MKQDELKKIITVSDSGVTLPCFLQPRAAGNKLVGIHDGMLKIRLTAPPVEGKANSALIKYLSKTLGVTRGSFVITSGLTSRRKTVFIKGITIDRILEKLSD